MALLVKNGGIKLETELQIVPWSSTDWKSKARMIAAHKSGEIDLYNYWQIGNRCVVPLAQISNSTIMNNPSQNIVIVLTDKDVYDLADNTGKCIYTWDMLGQISTALGMNSSATNIGGWDQCIARNWCNNEFYNALPADLKKLLPLVKVKASDGNRATTITESRDYCFLRSEIEVYGSLTNSVEGEGLQMEYYNNYNTKAKNNSWWLRSAAVNSEREFCYVGSDVRPGKVQANTSYRLVVCGCI